MSRTETGHSGAKSVAQPREVIPRIGRARLRRLLGAVRTSGPPQRAKGTDSECPGAGESGKRLRKERSPWDPRPPQARNQGAPSRRRAHLHCSTPRASPAPQSSASPRGRRREPFTDLGIGTRRLPRAWLSSSRTPLVSAIRAREAVRRNVGLATGAHKQLGHTRCSRHSGNERGAA